MFMLNIWPTVLKFDVVDLTTGNRISLLIKVVVNLVCQS